MSSGDMTLLGVGVENLGWTLVHFLWQGTLVALVLAEALHMLRHRSPQYAAAQPDQGGL